MTHKENYKHSVELINDQWSGCFTVSRSILHTDNGAVDMESKVKQSERLCELLGLTFLAASITREQKTEQSVFVKESLTIKVTYPDATALGLSKRMDEALKEEFIGLWLNH